MYVLLFTIHWLPVEWITEKYIADHKQFWTWKISFDCSYHLCTLPCCCWCFCCHFLFASSIICFIWNKIIMYEMHKEALLRQLLPICRLGVRNDAVRFFYLAVQTLSVKLDKIGAYLPLIHKLTALEIQCMRTEYMWICVFAHSYMKWLDAKKSRKSSLREAEVWQVLHVYRYIYFFYHSTRCGHTMRCDDGLCFACLLHIFASYALCIALFSPHSLLIHSARLFSMILT